MKKTQEQLTKMGLQQYKSILETCVQGAIKIFDDDEHIEYQDLGLLISRLDELNKELKEVDAELEGLQHA